MADTELEIDLEEAAKAEDKPEVKEPAKEEPKAAKPSLDDWKAKQEERASRFGWVPFDEWVESGKDPDDWKDAPTFNVVGDFTSKLRKKEREYEENLAGVNKIVAAQRALMEQRREEAIDAGDTKLVHKIEGQIAELQRTPVAKSDPLIAEWEERNPWVLEPGTPKTVFAQAQFAAALQNRMTTAQAIKHVEAEVAKHFPAPQRQGRVPESEKGGGNKGFHKGRALSLSWGDLTSQEQAIWDLTGDTWKSKEEFLKAAAESRKGA